MTDYSRLHFRLHVNYCCLLSNGQRCLRTKRLAQRRSEAEINLLVECIISNYTDPVASNNPLGANSHCRNDTGACYVSRAKKRERERNENIDRQKILASISCHSISMSVKEEHNKEARKKFAEQRDKKCRVLFCFMHRD